MNRRGFIRRALAAVAGAAAGVMMPSTPVEKVAEIIQDPFRDGVVFQGIRWIEDVDCPPDTIYFMNYDALRRNKISGRIKL